MASILLSFVRALKMQTDRMPNFLDIESDFLDKVISTIEENLADENFGVSELAERLDMSRSNLLRKVQKLTELSVSVLIRQVRLDHAQEFLRSDTFTVSEVSYKVGFNSVSYFTKCFREHYGYPPGEEKSKFSEAKPKVTEIDGELSISKKWLWPVALLIAIILVAIFYPKRQESQFPSPEKSIAVMPFKNDSNDSSNLYLVNGLMEAVLNNLQKIEDLRVVSRTSVEKYRNSPKNIAEISEELGVSYVLEGSGQKVGDQILLTIQLIQAPKDTHLWSEQYNRLVTDIFGLQAEVAKDIAGQIEVIITPAEAERIARVPTEDIEAYDLYLKGFEYMIIQTDESSREAIKYFKLAIERDPSFAEAQAYIAVCYYFLDIFQAQQKYKVEINTYADRALLANSELPISLIAKGLFYMHDKQYELAAEYFEKALIYNPNSTMASNFLSDIYASYLPNTRRYLKYALRGIKSNVLLIDSPATSVSYLHLSNALAQSGFFDEAEFYIEKSIAYDASNIFSRYLYPYIKFAQGNDIPQTLDLLLEVLKMDTTRLDVVNEVAKMYFYLEDYDLARQYYGAFSDIKERYKLDLFDSEELNIAFVLRKMGRIEEANKHLAVFKSFVDNDESIYHDLLLSSYYAYIGDVDQGIEHLKKFSEQRDYFYWLVMMLEDDPILKLLSDHPDFMPTLQKIEDHFWEVHKDTRSMLEEEGLLTSSRSNW